MSFDFDEVDRLPKFSKQFSWRYNDVHWGKWDFDELKKRYYELNQVLLILLCIGFDRA